MEIDAVERFDAGAAAWAEYNRSPLGYLRAELTWHNLARHLPPVDVHTFRPQVLDAGGGSGELAVRLVREGYRVWLLDPAPAMLDLARSSTESLPGELREHLAFCQMELAQAAQAFAARSFEAIACHTLLEYLPDPEGGLETLAGLLRPGGLLSVSFVNRHSQVLRDAWQRVDPATALAHLDDPSFRAGLFGVTGISFSAEQVGGWLAGMGLSVVAHYGVRFFADYIPSEQLGEVSFLATLLDLEKAVAGRAPYKHLARYVHLIAR
jgi:2-polyprenyl-3-methyl-5-hydroxy-6-metoxy-1,4-benzoquinol methylase